jgi:hypothetical protein
MTNSPRSSFVYVTYIRTAPERLGPRSQALSSLNNIGDNFIINTPSTEYDNERRQDRSRR